MAARRLRRSYADPSACFVGETAGKFRDDELATRRLRPARTPIQRVSFVERLESKCEALAGRPLKINTKSPRNQRTIQESGLSRKKQQDLKSSAVCLNFVGETGFEPATSNSRSWRANRTALHPELLLRCKYNIYFVTLYQKNADSTNEPAFHTPEC